MSVKGCWHAAPRLRPGLLDLWDEERASAVRTGWEEASSLAQPLRHPATQADVLCIRLPHAACSDTHPPSVLTTRRSEGETKIKSRRMSLLCSRRWFDPGGRGGGGPGARLQRLGSGVGGLRGSSTHTLGYRGGGRNVAGDHEVTVGVL